MPNLLLSGDVIRIFDPTTTPRKHKRVICVCPERLLFLRINTFAVWKPNVGLLASENDFLDHDSYVELHQLLRFARHTIDDALARRENLLGELSNNAATEIIRAVWGAPNFSADDKDLIRGKLDPLFDPDE